MMQLLLYSFLLLFLALAEGASPSYACMHCSTGQPPYRATSLQGSPLIAYVYIVLLYRISAYNPPIFPPAFYFIIYIILLYYIIILLYK